MESSFARIAPAIERMVRERLRLFLWPTIVWAVVSLPLQSWALDADTPAWLVASNAVLTLGCIATLVRARTPSASMLELNTLGVTLGLGVLAISAGMLRVDLEAAHFWVIPLVFIGSGVLLLDRRFLLAFLSVGSAITLGLGRPNEGSTATHVMVMAVAVVVSVLLHEITRRMVFDVEYWRIRDQDQRLALEAALAEANKQLHDRERLELERQEDEKERELLREQLAQAQKMEAIGTLAGGLAHDMNNVLGGILGVADLMLEVAPPELKEDIESIIESTRRGSDLTRNLVGFARRGKYRRESVSIPTVASELVRLLTRTVPKGVEFSLEMGTPPPTIEGDPALITQALMNLCLNSIDAMRGVGTIVIAAADVDIDADRARSLQIVPGRYVRLDVKDNGSGMSAEIAARIFEPFFTTKGVGHGTGLGLAMVDGVVRSYAGGIDVETEPGRGTRISLYLPSSPPALEGRQTGPHAAVTHSGGLILVVDDDPQVSRVGRRILEQRGFTVLSAVNGKDALEVFEAHPEIELVILDMAMPVMGGRECFVQMQATRPGTRVLLASGYAIELDAQACLAEGACGFLDKPFNANSLLRMVTDALSTGPARSM